MTTMLVREQNTPGNIQGAVKVQLQELTYITYESALIMDE